MKTVMLLVVPAVALLISLSVAKPTGHQPAYNLNHIVDIAKKYNDSVSKEIFVEDVSPLAEGTDKCGNKFFCKVHKILHDHERNNERRHKGKEEKELVKLLKNYITSVNLNCTTILQDVTPSVESKPIPALVDCLTKCIQYKNLNSA